MRKIFDMTEEQHTRLMKACEPTPAVCLSGGVPMFPSAQQNANDAWRQLGEELGFVWDTAEPVPGMCDRHFSAEVRT